jgi:hypothetical protein
MFARVPSPPTKTICASIELLAIIGFYGIFGSLLYRAYTLSKNAETLRKRNALQGDPAEKAGPKHKLAKIVFSVIGIVFLILAIVGAATVEEPSLNTNVVEEGIENFEYMKCKRNLVGTIFIGLEGTQFSLIIF